MRFLAATLGGWTLVRTGMLWPTLEMSRDLVRGLTTPAVAASVPVEPRIGSTLPALASAIAARPVAHPSGPVTAHPPPPHRPRLALGAASFLSFGRATPIEEDGAVPPPLRPTAIDRTRRLTASAWGILREGTPAGLPGGQLGGSQAGLRVAYGLGRAQRVALAARLSTPLQGQGAEAAFGVEIRPAVLPVRIIAEQRVALDGGRGGSAIYAVGGVNPTPIAAGFRLEAYAQGGVVVRGGAQGFADGAARFTRPLAPTFDLGVGAWGGVQPGVSRVDIGPTLGVALPVAGRTVRITIDWRQRVAGDARPGSGPALSLGSDF